MENSVDTAVTTIHHNEYLRDRVAMAAVRVVIRSLGKSISGPAARGAFDDLMEKTPTAPGVTYNAEEVGGVQSWWCRPPNAVPGCAILYLHGGAYGLGSARAFRHFAGHIAARTGVAALIPDYSLAPEHPFPAAVNDATGAYTALVDRGIRKIALVGDSAGGGLALVVLSVLVARAREKRAQRPVGAAVMSPWTDLALTGESVESRADADPLLTKETLLAAAQSYLGTHDPRDPLASPLYAALSDLPPIRVHVGEDEILLDDSIRYGESVERAGGAIEVHSWQGMVHVFPSNLAFLRAAKEAIDDIGDFLGPLLR